ncbi:growth arrest-specific protein 2-like [Haliotis rufescens]|uniref:growth arrest-specific protein 2-like n=1 Tax=Haliotis rufescens TaxID=6454 RepID=UPI00201F9C13|nr:growth arrest-specific protein 2-like [Haliotis rufescens]XP_046326255.2 growth arrest-specific protein 2-like [Haliotis rufescens]
MSVERNLSGNNAGDMCEGFEFQKKVSDLQEQSLGPLKEDLVDWLGKTLSIDLSTDTFMTVLDNGVYLCQLAKLIESKARECFAEGKVTEPLPKMKLKCNNRAQSGTWFARDNTANFLQWGKEWGMKDECLFDTETLVSHKKEKPVIVCLLELARLGYKYGLEPPNIIKMENEIKHEEDDEEDEVDALPQKTIEIVEKRPTKAAAPANKKPVKLDLDTEVRRIATKCRCQQHVKRIREGLYSIFGKTIFIRLLMDKHLMVRVGGGWDTLEHYLIHHDPSQVYTFHRSNSRDNILDNVDGDRFLYVRGKYKK